MRLVTHTQKDKQCLENIQQAAARIIFMNMCNDYRKRSSVTQMMNQLGWDRWRPDGYAEMSSCSTKSCTASLVSRYQTLLSEVKAEPEALTHTSSGPSRSRVSSTRSRHPSTPRNDFRTCCLPSLWWQPQSWHSRQWPTLFYPRRGLLGHGF